MKIKVSETTPLQINWLVAKCEGLEFDENGVPIWFADDGLNAPRVCYSPSTDWSQGGPIIERERIWLQPEVGKEETASAWYAVSMHDTDAYGPTPLIAAMRCFVASRLGEEAEIPEALV